MRILFLIDNLGSGGAQRQVKTLSTLMARNSHDVTILTYSPEDFFSKDLEALGIPIIRCYSSNYIRRILLIYKEIHKGHYDTVISFLDTPNFINNLSTLISRRNWKVVTSERSNKESFLISKKGRIFGWFQRYSDAIVCNSYNATNMWVKYYPKYRNKLKIIYNAVEVEPTYNAYTPKQHEKLHIVVAASYQRLKNPIKLIQAVSLLSPSEQQRLRIDWYGETYVGIAEKDYIYKEACSLIEHNNLEEVVHLHKPTKDIHNKMSQADFVALFSQLEGLPNAICEGMMLGKPIIMSRVSDYNILVDRNNGLLCEWDDELSIKNAIEIAINLSKREIMIMGKNSLKKAEMLFSPNVIIKKWEELIESL
ncbi:glycosyltransferase [Porphyromonas somerae]|uniref:glycosyltransferase n=1 Tax=Porphyromonas somerae TaxID=322095 RepID=UPI00035E56FC|nr:glycosyltransferase [Porphyromonas somerae]